MAGMKQSYYSLVHPQTDWTAFEKERADAMYYDESRLRECVKTLMDELACKTGNEDGSSFRSAVKWDDRRDCFSFLEIKISLAEKEKVYLRFEADVKPGRFRESGPVAASVILPMQPAAIREWLASGSAIDKCMDIFMKLIRSAYS